MVWPNDYQLVRIVGGASMGNLYCKPADWRVFLSAFDFGIRVYDNNGKDTMTVVAQRDDTGHIWVSQG